MAMNNNVLLGASFLTGLVVGGLAGAKLMEHRLANKFDSLLKNEIEDTRAFYSALHKPQYPTPADAVADLVPEAAAEATTKYQGLGGPKVAYDKIKKSSVVVNEVKHELVERNIFETPPPVENNRGPIYIISQDEYMENESGYVQSTLNFYAKDEVLTDDREEKFEDRKSIMGDVTNADFGRESSDPDVVHIRNEVLQLDVEICRSHGSYAVEVLGLDDEEPIQTPRSRLRGE